MKRNIIIYLAFLLLAFIPIPDRIFGDLEIVGSLKTMKYFSTPIYLYGGSSLTADCDSSNSFYTTLSANAALTISDMTDGQIINIWITNTASNYTMSIISPTITWKGNTAPVVAVGAKTTLITIAKVGSQYNGAAGSEAFW